MENWKDIPGEGHVIRSINGKKYSISNPGGAA